MQKYEKAIRTASYSIWSNAILALLKGISGFFGNSYALIADAIESTTDVFSSTLVLMGLKYSQKPADENHPYGHGKIESLTTFAVVAFLVTSATVIAYESIQNIIHPHKVPEVWTLYVLGIIIIWKEISFQIVSRRSKQLNSSSLKADAWHHRSDAITSIIAFAGISIALFFGAGYESADDWAALMASGFILYNSYLIFRPAFGELMDEHVYNDLEQQVRKQAIEVPGIEGVEKCLVRKSGLVFHIEIHVFVDGGITVDKGYKISRDLKKHLKKEFPDIEYIVVRVEPDSKQKQDTRPL